MTIKELQKKALELSQLTGREFSVTQRVEKADEWNSRIRWTVSRWQRVYRLWQDDRHGGVVLIHKGTNREIAGTLSNYINLADKAKFGGVLLEKR